jgi:pentose-5-phosphate-3-epimerase
VDGGVSADTASIVGGYGVDVCVVGSALFQRGRDAAREVDAVKAAAG